MRKALFSAASSAPPGPSDRSNQTVTNTIGFPKYLSWEGFGVKSVYDTGKDGVWRCLTKILNIYIFQEEDGFNRQRG